MARAKKSTPPEEDVITATFGPAEAERVREILAEQEAAEVAPLAECDGNHAAIVTCADPECWQKDNRATVGQAAASLDFEMGVGAAGTDAQGQDTRVPRDVPLPFPRPPFAFEAAMQQIEAKERSSAAAWTRYESAKETASARRKEAEEEDQQLHDLIRETRDRREEAQREGGLLHALVQLEDQPNPEAQKPGCAFERGTGQPCPICRDAKPGDETRDEPENPLHPEHVTAAAIRAASEALRADLVAVDVYLALDELDALDYEDAHELGAWASALHISRTSDSSIVVPVRPALLDQACQAAEPGTDRQGCRVCGTTLVRASGEPYPAGALVGIDCLGAEVEESRPVAKRGAKKSRKKIDHDAIAKEQRMTLAKDDEATAAG